VLSLNASQASPLKDMASQDLEGGAHSERNSERSEHAKSLFLVTNSKGASVLDAHGKAREFLAEKPSMAAQKAFYSWRRARESFADGEARVRVDGDLRAWIQGLPGVSAEQAARFLARMEQVRQGEVSTGMEVFIARSGQLKPRRYVCYQKLNDRPNAHQVRKLIVMESKAHPCAEGKPEGVRTVLRPYS
jgi:hypothetical protein